MGGKNRITALLPHLVRDLFNPTNTPGGRKICVAGFKAQNTTCSSRDEGGLEDWRKVGETHELEPRYIYWQPLTNPQLVYVL